MYKQKIAPPYYIDKNGTKKTTFPLRNFAGVYLIYENTVLKYIGYSGTDLYKTMYRHFQTWKDNKQVRVVYNWKNTKVRIVYCKTAKQADTLEKASILKYKPIDNTIQYDLYETDEQEKKVYRQYIDTETKPIIKYEGETPF
jgi:hypothetical protein